MKCNFRYGKDSALCSLKNEVLGGSTGQSFCNGEDYCVLVNHPIRQEKTCTCALGAGDRTAWICPKHGYVTTDELQAYDLPKRDKKEERYEIGVGV